MIIDGLHPGVSVYEQLLSISNTNVGTVHGFNPELETLLTENKIMILNEGYELEI